jgi:P-type Ca2+ transporter type 2C
MLTNKQENRDVTLVRGGKSVLVNIYDVVVGDIMHLEAGDLVPVDGVLLNGYDVSCDESAATGETGATGEGDGILKVSGDVALSNTPPGIKFMQEYDPFILSGAKVLGGVGNFIVTAVGPNSFNGRTMMGTSQTLQD